jgi:hypothetical protein
VRCDTFETLPVVLDESIRLAQFAKNHDHSVWRSEVFVGAVSTWSD